MAARLIVGIVSLIMLAFSGCIAGEATPESKPPGGGDIAAPPEFDEETGALYGVVTDEEGKPVEGATVGLIELPEKTGTTSAAGDFSLNNLPPGTYTLAVGALGFESNARKIEVRIGEITEVTFTMVALPVDVPYPATLIQLGYVLCTVRFYPGVPTGGLAGSGIPRWITGVAVCGVAPIPTLPPDKFLLRWTLAAEGATEILHETTWQSNQALGKGQSSALEVDGRSNIPDATYGDAMGPSPLSIHANESKMLYVAEKAGSDCMTSKCKFQTRMFGSANTTEFYWPIPPPDLPVLGKPSNKIDIGFVYDQKNTQYLTSFHGMTRPLGFSVIEDQ